MTVSRFQQSLDLQSNDIVGCDGNSFIVHYLVNVLNFRPENIMQINSSEDYHEAFKKRKIAAAFFVSPHANVFLAKYCHSYEKIGRTHKLGGFGFVIFASFLEQTNIIKLMSIVHTNTIESDVNIHFLFSILDYLLGVSEGLNIGGRYF